MLLFFYLFLITQQLIRLISPRHMAQAGWGKRWGHDRAQGSSIQIPELKWFSLLYLDGKYFMNLYDYTPVT